MFCNRCGKENAAGAAFCAHCGAQLSAPSSPPPPPPASLPPGAAMQPPLPPMQPPPGQPPQAQPVQNYLVWAILSTLFCCIPFGVVSIVFASQVNGKLAVGDVAGAQQAAKNARTWAWVAFGTGLVIGLLYVVMMAVGIAGAASGSM